MATRPALRQRKASPAAVVARSSPPPPPQSWSPTSTTTTTTSSSLLTPDLSLDGPASPLFAGLDEDPVPKENVTVTVRFRPRSLREIRQGEEVAWYADGDTVVRSEQNPNVAYAYVGHRRRQWWFLAASRALRKEGEFASLSVRRLRKRQMRNFFVCLMVSQGVPMFYMGDEYGHTKGGNNNTYCHDHYVNYFCWDKKEQSSDLHRFCCLMTKFRKVCVSWP